MYRLGEALYLLHHTICAADVDPDDVEINLTFKTTLQREKFHACLIRISHPSIFSGPAMQEAVEGCFKINGLQLNLVSKEQVWTHGVSQTLTDAIDAATDAETLVEKSPGFLGRDTMRRCARSLREILGLIGAMNVR